MKKFTTVMTFVFLFSIVAILFVVYRGNSIGRELAQTVKYDSLPAFPITKEKLPEGLVWSSGGEHKPFASSKALKGGVYHKSVTTYPTTFRQYGPNANTAFRSYLDDNDMDLFGIHPVTLKYFPILAKEWAIGPDKRTVYFRLNPDAKWSDGHPVTADDFVYGVKHLRSESILSPYTKNYMHTMFERILKFDDYLIGVRLPAPKADLIYNCGASPIPYHFYGKLRQVEVELPVTQAMRVLLHDEKEISPSFQKTYDEYLAANKSSQEPVEEPKVKITKDDVREDWVNFYQWKVQPRTGPYVVHSWIKGKEIVLKRVKDWWAKDKKLFKNRYNVDYIHIKLIRDTNIAFEHFKKGELDTFRLNDPDFWHVKGKYLLPVEKGYMNKLVYYNDKPRPSRLISFNMSKKPLDDINVRLGLAHSFNLEKLFKTIMKNDAFRQEAFADGYGDYTTKEFQPRKFDPKKAVEYFAKAGYTERDQDGVLVKDGKRLEFKFLYPSESDTPKMILLKGEAKKAGVSLELDNYDPNTVFVSMLDKKHQIAWHGWAPGFRPRYWGGYHSDNADKKKTTNFSNIKDKELDELIIKFRNGKESEERIKLSHKIEERIFDLAPAIPTFKTPFFRYAYWRWIKLPEFHSTKSNDYLDDYGLFWIDQDLEKEIRSKMLKEEIIYGTEKLIINDTYKPGKVK